MVSGISNTLTVTLQGIQLILVYFLTIKQQSAYQGRFAIIHRSGSQKAKQILSQLKIRNFDQKVKQLSGGQLKRVALANALITEPELLILDEPTNHLDLDMTEWLEEYLRRTNLSLLMVTHDRYFLDRVCSEIIEIDNRQLYQ